MYTFKATINRVMPNGIINITFDLGFNEKYTSNCLLHDVAILHNKEEQAGQFLKDMLPIGEKVYVNSVKLDQHGRPIVKIFRFFDNGQIDNMSVNNYLDLENLSW